MVRKELKNKPVEKVVEYMKDLCNILPFNQTYKTECINGLSDVDMVIKLLQSNMSAKAMCGIFMSCSGFDDHVDHHKQPETNVLVPLVQASPVKAGDICTDCVNFVTDLKNLLTDPNTESQLIGMLKQIVCAQLGSVEAICDDLVDTYIPQGLNILSSYVDPQVECSAVGFCTGQQTPEMQSKFNDMKKFVLVVLKKMGLHVSTNALECDACKAVTSDIRNMARDTTIQRKVVDFIEQNVCSHFGDLKTLCTQAIEDNYVVVFQLIAGSLVDDQVCVDLGMCASSAGLTQSKLGSIPCEACTVVINAISTLESSPTVQNTVKNFIDNYVCPKLGSAAGQCKTDVDMYSQAAFEILKEILNAGYLCGKMNLCAAPAPKLKSNGALCEVCTTILTEVDNLLKDQNTQAEIESLLDDICARLSGNLSAQCKTFVDEYAPFVLTLLAQEIDPAKICQEVNFCPANQPIKALPPKAASKPVKSSSTECEACEFVMNEVEMELKKNGSRVEIKDALEKACTTLPDTLQNYCNTFVNLYFDILWEMLKNDFNPKKFCVLAHLCPAQQKLESPTLSKVHVVPLMKENIQTKMFNFGVPKSSEECYICELVLNYVSEALKEPVTATAIKSLLEKACGEVPSEFQQECETLVDAYSDKIVQWLQTMDDPYTVCPRLGLCGAKSQTVPKVGPKATPKDTNLYFRKHTIVEKKCEQGPKYWCLSRDTARLCQKEEYCLRRNLVNRLR